MQYELRRVVPGYIVTLGKCRSFNLPGVGSGSMFGTHSRYVHRMNSSSARLDQGGQPMGDGKNTEATYTLHSKYSKTLHWGMVIIGIPTSDQRFNASM
jgi:hypothetical protein